MDAPWKVDVRVTDWLTDLSIKLNEVEEDNILTLESDGSMKRIAGLGLEHGI